MDKWKKLIKFLMILIFVSIKSNEAISFDGRFYIGMDSEYTDNSLRTSTDNKHDVIMTGSTGMTLNHASPELDLVADYSVMESTYLEETQGDETSINGRSDATWRISPHLLRWNFSHLNARSRGVRSLPDIAENRTTQTLYATGPATTFTLSPRDSISAQAQLMRAETSGRVVRQSTREIYDVEGRHQTSAIQTFRITASEQHIDFENDQYPSSILTSGALHWYREHGAGEMGFSIGTNKTERENNSDVTGSLLRGYVQFERFRHGFSLAAARELTDSMTGLHTRLDPVTGGTFEPVVDNPLNPEIPNLDVVDVLEAQRIEINYSTSRLCSRCEPSIRLSRDKQDYVDQPLDQIIQAIDAALRYRMTDDIFTSFSFLYANEKYLDLDGRSDDLYVQEISIIYQPIQRLIVDGSIAHRIRQSNVDESEYKASSIQLGMRYYIAEF